MENTNQQKHNGGGSKIDDLVEKIKGNTAKAKFYTGNAKTKTYLTSDRYFDRSNGVFREEFMKLPVRFAVIENYSV